MSINNEKVVNLNGGAYSVWQSYKELESIDNNLLLIVCIHMKTIKF